MFMINEVFEDFQTKFGAKDRELSLRYNLINSIIVRDYIGCRSLLKL